MTLDWRQYAAMAPSLPPHSIEDIVKKIHPETIRSNLIRAGLVLAAWELIENEVEKKVRDFYIAGFDEKKQWIYSPDYETKVLDRHKYAFEASLLWLVDRDALDEDQADKIRAFREYRNKVGHEMPTILVEVGHDIDVVRIREMRDVIAALGQFWGRIEVEIDPDLVGKDVDYTKIQSGMLFLIDHLIAAAEAGESSST